MSSNKKKMIGFTILADICLIVAIHIIEYLYDMAFEKIMYLNIMVIIALLAVIVLELTFSDEQNQKSDNEENDSEKEDNALWELNKEKEDFFTLWAHQIKTPIAAMNLLVQAENQDLKLYKMELFKIEEYVSTALNYLRFEGMSNDLRLEKVSLKIMINQTVKKYRNIFINKHLTVNMQDIDLEVLTDEKWFQFVLEQIISNALKYTENGSITFIGEKNDQEVRLTIKDTGIGIKSEDMPRIFEKGFTGFNGRIDKKASGLGLYLVKGVVDKLGHGIQIESIENVGTSVTIIAFAERVSSSDLIKD